MKILIINSGSSSLKYQLYDMTTKDVIAKGMIERIGIPGGIMNYSAGSHKIKYEQQIDTHDVALNLVIKELISPEHGVLKSLDGIDAIGHRVVHGGEHFSGSVLITDEVLKGIEACCDLAPLHNPPNLMGIKAAMRMLPGKPNVAVFDTSFHAQIPKEHYLYGVPMKYYTEYGVRRYGFHGTSHRYVSTRAAEFLGKKLEDVKLITVHIGNGTSLAAVEYGRSIDTSLGFGTVSGPLMSSRCGDLDPAALCFIMEKEAWNAGQVRDFVHKECGLKALCGSTDMRDIEERSNSGDEAAITTLKVLAHTLRKYIGAYAAVLDGADAIVFTAGVGENDTNLRAMVCSRLNYLGAHLDLERNKVKGKDVSEPQEISTPDSTCKILMVPTNEELMIAQDTAEIVSKL